MEFRLSFNKKAGYAEINSSGHIDIQGIVDTLGKLFSNENWSPGMSILADYTDSSTIDLNSELVSQISHLVKGQNEIMGEGKLAIIMSSDLDYGYARMFQLLTEDYIDKEVNIYRDRETAYEWIISSESVEINSYSA